MCGVLGIFGSKYVAQDLYDGLTTLQHRGQDATGMITYDGNAFQMKKGMGLVKDVFRTKNMMRLQGQVGIGHTRYSTIGSGGALDAQPFLSNAFFGVALAHNGNLFNAHELKKELFEKDHRLVNSDCDAEVILNVFTKALTKQNVDGDVKFDHFCKAVKSVFDRSQGAYSVVSYVAKHGMVAFRDPHGIRPLIFGKRKAGLVDEYIFSSEQVTLDILGFEVVRDVAPGEVIWIDEDRKVHSKVLTNKKHIPCIFEYIYFARPDSVIDKISVHKARLRMGEAMTKQIKASGVKVDVVMPVPDSSRTSAIALAQALKLPYREGLIKNRYIGRTFIMPGQAVRKKSIKYKLNAMPLEFEGKNVLLIDDSIVRGNTSKQIVQMCRKAGAKKIYFASYSPPVINPCVYGIDIPTHEELIASANTVEEIGKYIGVDKLFYGDLKDVFEACIVGNPELKDMCMAG
ncbi:amidophosphoribosyltransferase, partial [Candidatus Peregrinibacteria bacterium]|nr:amidophosphoribosyltransferase [Candidatus Peregrinibacteria bacterium]